MKKTKIEIFDYAREILTSVQKGVLITTKSNKVNSMTISWGTIGIEWGMPIFTTFIRTGRFTNQQLNENPEFTVNIPYGSFDKKIIGFCGSNSGRNVDKIKELNLTLIEANKISAPAIKQLPLTLECKVIYQQTQIIEKMLPDVQKSCYPIDIPSTSPMANKDTHTAFYGQILDAYIIED